MNDSVVLPSTPSEKSAFKDVVKSLARDYNNELNFQEAVKYASWVYSPSNTDCETRTWGNMQGSVRDILLLRRGATIGPNASKFRYLHGK